MSSESDEFLSEIADQSSKIVNLLMKNIIETEFSNDLKLYEMYEIDETEFKQRYENYKFKQAQINQYIYKQ